MSIRTWPKSERPRERLLSLGVGALSDGELIAVLLGMSPPGQDGVSYARSLLAQAGGLQALLTSPAGELLARRGMGIAGYCRLQAGTEMGRRFLAGTAARAAPLTNPEGAASYLNARLGGLGHEVFCCLFLDGRHRLICCEEMFRGTLDGAPVYPREIVKRALHHNAAGIILGHNHPSGCPEPSAADRRITQRLKAALALVDIPVLDHLVVAGGSSVSLAGRGWL